MYILQGNSPLPSLAAGARLLVEGFRTLFYQELKETASVFPQVFEIRESRKRSETDFEMLGPTMAQLSTIGAPSPQQTIADGNTKEVINLLYKLSMRFTEEDIEDDLYSVLGRAGKLLPKTFTRRSEALAAGTFAQMFTTLLGFDGSAICSTSHSYYAGYSDIVTGATTWSNRLAVDSALSPETLQGLQLLLTTTKTREGIPAGLTGKVLVFPPHLEARAWETVSSLYRAYTDTNEKNTFAQGALWPIKCLKWEWLPSTTMYALIDPEQTPFFYQWRSRPQFREQTDMNNGVQEFYGKMRCNASACEPRGVAATPGA
jgi:hypothetical protein